MKARVVLIVLVIYFLGETLGIAEHQGGVGIDGLRCDSCGMECSTVCGSRQFRTCCYNYIKKRGDPALSHTNLNGGSSPDSKTPSSEGAASNGVLEHLPASFQFPSKVQRSGPPRFYRRSVGSFLGASNDLPTSLDYMLDDSLSWYPYLARVEEEEKGRGGRYRLY